MKSHLGGFFVLRSVAFYFQNPYGVAHLSNFYKILIIAKLIS